MDQFWIRVSWALVVIMVTIGLIVIIEQGKDDEDDNLPVPPPGYHWCTDTEETDLDFCRNRR